MRRVVFGIGIALVVLVLAGAWAVRQPAIQDRILDRAVVRAVTRTAELPPPDALGAWLLGSSGPLPHPTRGGPSVAIFAGGRFFVVDVGRGSANRLAMAGVDASRIGGVLLTHFHSDHVAELGEWDLQTWVAGRPAPLRVFGPPGVERVVAGFEEAYALDAGYRTAHHGEDFLPPELGRMTAFPVPGPSQGRGPTVVLEEDGLRITAFAVDHAPVRPAYGYRFDYAGRSVVVSGDTARSEALVEAARGADVLFHEAQADHIVARVGAAAREHGRPRPAHIMDDIPDYHTTPVEAARVANEAGVALVVFYHLTPPPPVRLMERVYVRGVDEVRPEGWRLGEDGLLVVLPGGSDELELRGLL